MLPQCKPGLGRRRLWPGNLITCDSLLKEGSHLEPHPEVSSLCFTRKLTHSYEDSPHLKTIWLKDTQHCPYETRVTMCDVWVGLTAHRGLFTSDWCRLHLSVGRAGISGLGFRLSEGNDCWVFQGERGTRFDGLSKQACAIDRTEMEEKKGYTFLRSELHRASRVSRIMSA